MHWGLALKELQTLNEHCVLWKAVEGAAEHSKAGDIWLSGSEHKERLTVFFVQDAEENLRYEYMDFDINTGDIEPTSKYGLKYSTLLERLSAEHAGLIVQVKEGLWAVGVP